MNKDKSKEMKNNIEFMAHVAEMLHQSVNRLESEFETSPEGREKKFLMNVRVRFINSYDNFLLYFLSGENGKRGVDKMIYGLEHPGSTIGKDKKLLGKLKELSAKILHEKLPDADEWIFYKDLEKEVRSMPVDKDLQSFIEKFRTILDKASKYGSTDVAIKIKEHSTRSMPKRIALEQFKTSVLLWLLIYFRLVFPPEENKHVNMFEEAIAQKMKKSKKEFREMIGLLKDTEDEYWNNWKSFSASVKNKGRSHALMHLFEKFSQEDNAKKILLENIGKGREVFLQELEKFIKIIRSESTISSAELAGTKELADMIALMRKKMEDSIEHLRKEFDESISSRISDLDKSHSKKLKELKRLKDELLVYNKNSAFSLSAIDRNFSTIKKGQETRKEHNERLFDIICITHARMAFQDFLEGRSDESRLSSDLRSIISKRPSQFALDTIERMRTFQKRGRDLAPFDDFLARIDEQIPKLSENQRINNILMLKILKKIHDLKTGLDFHVANGVRKAHHAMKRMKELGIETERHELSGNTALQ